MAEPQNVDDLQSPETPLHYSALGRWHQAPPSSGARRALWFILPLIGGGLVVWVKAFHVGYVLEGLNGDAVWYWELVLILIAAGLHSRTSMIVAGVWVSVLLALSLIAGFNYRQYWAPNKADSMSPTRKYEVTVAVTSSLLDDSALQLRIVRHVDIFDYRYVRLCASGGDDLGQTITWLANDRFQVFEPPDGAALTVKMSNHSFTFKNEGGLAWHKC